jgi:hypothetical protein
MTDARHDREPGSLEAAIAATKRQFAGQSERADATELRILTATRLRTRPRRTLWLVPMAAAFLLSAAFAAGGGSQLAEVAARVFGRTAPEPDLPARVITAPAAPPASSVPTASSELSAPEPPRAVPAPSAAPTATSAATRSKAAATPTPSGTFSGPAPAPTDELTLYKHAHRAHFTDHDYARALAGWDQYLASAPRGTFALEARYNRAIALHRLGNRSAAIEALRPFADGAYGRYRQEEARQLIEQGR